MADPSGKFNGNRSLMQKIGGTVLTFVLVTLVSSSAFVGAADRTTCVVPRGNQVAGLIPAGAIYPDQAMGDVASDGWQAYMRVWKALHEHPGDPTLRRFLGLPLDGAVEAKIRRGRSAPSWLRWRPGYQQVDTPHLTIYTHATAAATVRVAEDLESCYWVWTQMFFPFWEAAPQVSTIFKGLQADEDVADYLRRKPSRITVSRKLRVVMFRDAAEYQQTLGPDNPGIERSTGFYNDKLQTTFLYAAERDDAATRRHEMVHQLFRQATRSTLGNNMPGEDAGFWLVEGIAGYFESLQLRGGLATLGGWDSSRLQFARFRMLAFGDEMPMKELTADGRIAAQQRQDIARWYAHGIAQTHHLLHSSEPADRRYIYQQLAELYAVKSELGDARLTADPQRGLKSFLSIDDNHIKQNPPRAPLIRLCLAGCEVTEAGLALIPASPELQWLDLSRLPIGNEAVRRLVPQPESLQQLTLEATKVDAELQAWLSRANNLRELDLSWLEMDDAVIKSIAGARELETLWLTGTNVSDKSIDTIAGMKNLQAVDLQRTQVTAAGLARLRQARPELNLNPLELRAG
jgi:hypothetical protein